MPSPLVEFISFLVTCAIFGVGGFNFARRFTQPQSCIMFLFIFMGTFLCFFIRNEIRLITILGFPVFLKTTLLAFGLGLLIGLILSLRKHKASERLIL